MKIWLWRGVVDTSVRISVGGLAATSQPCQLLLQHPLKFIHIEMDVVLAQLIKGILKMILNVCQATIFVVRSSAL